MALIKLTDNAAINDNLIYALVSSNYIYSNGSENEDHFSLIATVDIESNSNSSSISFQQISFYIGNQQELDAVTFPTAWYQFTDDAGRKVSVDLKRLRNVTVETVSDTVNKITLPLAFSSTSSQGAVITTNSNVISTILAALDK